MDKTRQLVYRSYFIGFLISASLLTPSLPFMGLIIVPFLFHLIIHTSIRVNLCVIILYSLLEILLALGSPFLFLLSLIEQGVLFLFTLMINGFKKWFRNLAIILYGYYVVHSHIILFLFLSLFLYFTNESIQLLFNHRRFIFFPIILVLYNIVLFLATISFNRVLEGIFHHLKPMKKTVGFPTVN